MKIEQFLPRAIRFGASKAKQEHACDIVYMKECIALARQAMEAGEIPVGAVLVKDGEIIARAYNRRETNRHALHHAELLCIEEGCRALDSWRLAGCTLYVTLEPCPMCGGAIVNARIPRVVYGARDMRAGAFGSVLNLNAYPLNHKAELEGGVCQAECLALLREFFADKRD